MIGIEGLRELTYKILCALKYLNKLNFSLILMAKTFHLESHSLQIMRNIQNTYKDQAHKLLQLMGFIPMLKQVLGQHNVTLYSKPCWIQLQKILLLQEVKVLEQHKISYNRWSKDLLKILTLNHSFFLQMISKENQTQIKKVHIKTFLFNRLNT